MELEECVLAVYIVSTQSCFVYMFLVDCELTVVYLLEGLPVRPVLENDPHT